MKHITTLLGALSMLSLTGCGSNSSGASTHTNVHNNLAQVAKENESIQALFRDFQGTTSEEKVESFFSTEAQTLEDAAAIPELENFLLKEGENEASEAPKEKRIKKLQELHDKLKNQPAPKDEKGKRTKEKLLKHLELRKKLLETLSKEEFEDLYQGTKFWFGLKPKQFPKELHDLKDNENITNILATYEGSAENRLKKFHQQAHRILKKAKSDKSIQDAFKQAAKDIKKSINIDSFNSRLDTLINDTSDIEIKEVLSNLKSLANLLDLEKAKKLIKKELGAPNRDQKSAPPSKGLHRAPPQPEVTAFVTEKVALMLSPHEMISDKKEGVAFKLSSDMAGEDTANLSINTEKHHFTAKMKGLPLPSQASEKSTIDLSYAVGSKVFYAFAHAKAIKEDGFRNTKTSITDLAPENILHSYGVAFGPKSLQPFAALSVFSSDALASVDTDTVPPTQWQHRAALQMGAQSSLKLNKSLSFKGYGMWHQPWGEETQKWSPDEQPDIIKGSAGLYYDTGRFNVGVQYTSSTENAEDHGIQATISSQF